MQMTVARSLTVADLGERALVARITSRLAQPSWVVVGPGDDGAVIEQVPRTLEVLTTDALVEHVHFDCRFTPPDAIGRRALAVNLSDLAAMGARPRAALLSLILPPAFPVHDLDALVAGLADLAVESRIAVVGGNITSSPGPLIVDVTVTGHVHRRRVLRRTGARAGDAVYVTGSLGLAAVGLALLRDECADLRHGRVLSMDTPDVARARERYLRPLPRLRAGAALSDTRAATSCVDLSDGLADGVHRLAESCGLGIAIDARSLPIDPGVVAWHGGDLDAARQTALTAGDDYELLFTVAPRARGRLRAAARAFGDLTYTRIGTVTRTDGVVLSTPAGDTALPPGYAHFG